jgi:predicted enzyme related to lactoylglutathione lyase
MKNPKDAIVWFEIPVSDLEKSREFYQQVMQTKLVEQEMGPNLSLIFPVEDMKSGVSGHLYQGNPGNDNGPSVHFDAPAPLKDTLDRLVSAGGSIVSEEVKIPGGRFVYCKDPDGNSISMFNRN